eukprot:TRINITY_DN1919_c1_g1_i1.p2 TRINITY_DN1919_c1_g1~~TRINITY_DN1919_c1_g1_i1.p2  ORF type:complete len:284 (+),score=107.08 TRINITY_DN1919_c1_g1_i1:139-990(+)
MLVECAVAGGGRAGPFVKTSQGRAPQEFPERWEWCGAIGRGAHSTVQRVMEKDTGRTFAAKVIPGGAGEEAQLLAKCAHEHVVGIVDSFREGEGDVIVMELIDGGDVFTAIKTRALTDALAQRVLRCVAEALACIHKLGVVHRDVKAENVLLTPSGDVKLIDFGAAVYMGASPCLSSRCGSTNYIAPEILLTQMNRRKRYGREVDMWSLGVLLYVMLFARYPFVDASNETCSQMILEGQYYLPPAARLPPDALALLPRLLSVDPTARITAAEVVSHSYAAGTL